MSSSVATVRTSHRPDGRGAMWWLLSAALLAVAIDLPWRAATAGPYIPGIYFPGSTVVQATGGL